MTTITFAAGSTTHVTTFDVNGTAGDLVVITSDSAAPHYLIADGGTIVVSYCDISYSEASPADTWYAVASTDSGNNDGWVFNASGFGDTIYIPNDFPDLGTALLNASDGDNIVFTNSAAYSTAALTSSLVGIAISAQDGRRPVIDHTLSSGGAIVVTGAGWSFQGLTFRSTVDGLGGSALNLTGYGFEITDCVFEGSPSAMAGDWAGTVQSCQFRHIGTYVSQSSLAVYYRACEFLRMDVNRVINGAAATVVDNCTFIACVATNDIVEALTIRNCTAQGCRANLIDGRIFEATGNVTKCNAFECTAFANFTAGGTASGNTTVDPMHVNLYTDLRLLPASTLIRNGTNLSDAATDYNGAAFQDPPSIGACESIVIASATATSATTLNVVLTGTYIETEVEDRDAWTLTAGTMGAQVAVASIVWTSGSSTAALTTWPAMSPGVTYTVQVQFGGYGYDTADFTPSASYETTDTIGPYRYVAAISNAFGRQFFNLAGIPQTELHEDFEIGAETVLVKSTLYFPDTGALWVAGIRFTYTSKTDGAFHGVATSTQRIVAIPEGTLAVADVRSHLPDP